MITMSENITELLIDLSKAQAKIKNPVFDSVNPHFKNKFASLAAGLEVILPPFTEHGLSIQQHLTTETLGPDTMPMLTTILGHKSGQWIKSSIELILQKNDMQGLGAALTYARRQSAFAIAGIVGDIDDDGNEAAKTPEKTWTSPAANHATVQKPMHNYAPQANGALSEAQIKRLWAMASNLGWSPADTLTKIKQEHQKNSPAELTREEYTLLTSKLQVEIDKRLKGQ